MCSLPGGAGTEPGLALEEWQPSKIKQLPAECPSKEDFLHFLPFHWAFTNSGVKFSPPIAHCGAAWLITVWSGCYFSSLLWWRCSLNCCADQLHALPLCVNTEIRGQALNQNSVWKTADSSHRAICASPKAMLPVPVLAGTRWTMLVLAAFPSMGEQLQAELQSVLRDTGRGQIPENNTCVNSSAQQ